MSHAYTKSAPLSSLLSEIIQADVFDFTSTSVDPTTMDHAEVFKRVRAIMLTWPLAHEVADTSTDRLLIFARQLHAIRMGRAPAGMTREKVLFHVILDYCANEIRDSHQQLFMASQKHGGISHGAFREVLDAFDTILRSGIDVAAVPDRSFRGSYSQTATLGQIGRTIVSVNDPQKKSYGGFCAAEIVVAPGSLSSGGGIRVYRWDPAECVAGMHDDWDGVDSALYQCFQMFWEADQDGLPRLTKAVTDITGHDAMYRPVIYIDAIAVGEDHKGKGLGLDLVRAAVKRWATPETLVFAVLHPITKTGQITGAREKLERYAQPLGFENFSQGIYLQKASATRAMLSEEKSVITVLEAIRK